MIRLLTKCEYFRCRELLLDGEFSERDDRSFTAINVLSGEGTLDGEKFGAGDSFFVPRGEKYTLSGYAKVILTNEGKNGKNEGKTRIKGRESLNRRLWS
jgi:mannose-6-phosphate isomerase class I